MTPLRKFAFIATLVLAAQEQPQVFRITPVGPVAELRAEALAALKISFLSFFKA
jgi:hypothetical protein